MRLEQRELQVGLNLRPCLFQRPCQQLVRGTRVPHHRWRRISGTFITQRNARAVSDRLHLAAHRRALFCAAAVFALQMRFLFLALLRHVRIEFEWTPAQLCFDLAVELIQRLGQLTVANQAPRAHDIRVNVDGHSVRCGVGHFSSHHFIRLYAIACGGGARNGPLPSSDDSTCSRVNQMISAISVSSMTSASSSA